MPTRSDGHEGTGPTQGTPYRLQRHLTSRRAGDLEHHRVVVMLKFDAGLPGRPRAKNGTPGRKYLACAETENLERHWCEEKLQVVWFGIASE